MAETETKNTETKPATLSLEEAKGKLSSLISQVEKIRDMVTEDGESALRFKGNLNSAVASLGSAKDGV